MNIRYSLVTCSITMMTSDCFARLFRRSELLKQCLIVSALHPMVMFMHTSLLKTCCRAASRAVMGMYQSLSVAYLSTET